ncbi:hypothetical protein [Nocardia sp. N2S4-5]|uniref:hypothetical protein n=1 Tax=Nocardia sp. N2S4-5 TaxID=3351565 RepID=UPI0037D44375
MKPLVKPERVFNREREWDGLTRFVSGAGFDENLRAASLDPGQGNPLLVDLHSIYTTP